MVELCDERLDEVYHALASPTRRRIVSILAGRSVNIAKLVPEFDMSLAAVSKHVKLLERAGIVSTERKGRTHVCSLRAQGLRDAYYWLNGYQAFWQERLDALEQVLIEDDDEQNRR